MSNNLSLRSRDIPRQTKEIGEQELLLQEDESNSSINNSRFKSFSMAFDRTFAFNVIPELKGKNNIEIFINQCDAIYEEFGEEDCEVSLMAIIRSKISANVWLASKDCTSYKDLKQHLLNKFCDDTPLSAMMNRLIMLSQYQSEDIKSYADRASDIYERLILLSETFLKKGPEDSRDSKPVKIIYKKLLLDYWVKGIKDENLRQVVLSHNATDFASASKYAKDVEVVFRTYNANNKVDLKPGSSNKNYENKHFNHPKKPPINNNNFKIKEEFKHVQKNEKSENLAGPSGQKPNFKCNFCGKHGHIEKYCRKKEPAKINTLESKNDQLSQEIPPDILMAELIRKLSSK